MEPTAAQVAHALLALERRQTQVEDFVMQQLTKVQSELASVQAKLDRILQAVEPVLASTHGARIDPAAPQKQ